jgi:UDP-glucose 4-epimerase
MRILVTGSAGHLGEALVRTLRAQGRAVRGIDLLASTCTDHVGSITDAAFVEACMDGIDAVLHAATLHKPHVATHPRGDFVDTNIGGTLALLEAAQRRRVRAFVFTSTTSVFGDALAPPPLAPAAWIDEAVVPQPKNIYGVTKAAAEDLCQLFHRNHGLACVVLRTSRFFPEADDSATARAAFADANLKANELLYRRADLQDIVDAHLLALARAPALGFGRYLVSATSPFTRADLADLQRDPAAAIARHHPDAAALYAQHGWQLPTRIDRVYVNAAARAALGWTPRHDFAHLLACLRDGRDPRSALAQAVGSKGYHAETFDGVPYPVDAEPAPTTPQPRRG